MRGYQANLRAEGRLEQQPPQRTDNVAGLAHEAFRQPMGKDIPLMPTHRPRPERALPRTATAPVIGLLVAMLAVVGLMLLIRSGPEAADELGISVSSSGAVAAQTITPPPLTEPIIDPTLDATSQSQADDTTSLDTPLPPPTSAAIAAAVPTTAPIPTLPPDLPTATAVPPTASSTSDQSSDTLSASAELRAEPTAEPTAPPTATAQPAATATSVPPPTATAVPAPTSTPVPPPTATPTFVPAPTATLVPAPTATSTAIPATPVPAATGQSLSQLEAWMLNEVNRVRANAGLGPVAPSSALTSIGRDWSQNMANAGGISHRPSNQLSAMMPAGWSGWAENVAQAPFGNQIGSVEGAVQWAQNALEQSPGHYANMVGDYNTLGIGLHVQGTYVWVTQNFGKY